MEHSNARSNQLYRCIDDLRIKKTRPLFILSAFTFYGQSDVWSLGVILYELANLDRPFDASTMLHLLNKIRNEEVKILSHSKYTLQINVF